MLPDRAGDVLTVVVGWARADEPLALGPAAVAVGVRARVFYRALTAAVGDGDAARLGGESVVGESRAEQPVRVWLHRRASVSAVTRSPTRENDSATTGDSVRRRGLPSAFSTV